MYQELVSNIRIVKKPERTLAYVMNVGPYMGDQALFERLFSKVLRWTRRRGLMKSDLEAISIYHDDPKKVAPGKQRISVGVTVPKGTKPEAGIEVMTIPAGDFVVGSFEIHPDEYGSCWKEVMDWIRHEGKQVIPGPMYESYRNDPHMHPLGKHVVDICVPVAD